MKIAQIAPLYESVPPKFYGGTERVVSYLTEELVRQGDVVCQRRLKNVRKAATLLRYGSSPQSDLVRPVAFPRDHA